jgi:hypothetical protein
VKILSSIFAVLLLSSVAVAQTPAKPASVTPPAATAPAKPLASTTNTGTNNPPSSVPIPQLTEEEKIQVLVLQRNIAVAQVQITELQKEKAKSENDLGVLGNAIQKRLGPGFVIDRDKLIVTEAPAPVPAATTTTAPADSAPPVPVTAPKK